MSVNTSISVEPSDRQLAIPNGIEQAFSIMEYGLSAGSQRQYKHTFDLWKAHCKKTGIVSDNLSAANVIAFLESQNVARKTKMARLTHLRRIAQMLHTSDVSNRGYQQNYEQLKLLTLPKEGSNKSGQTRERKALKPNEFSRR